MTAYLLWTEEVRQHTYAKQMPLFAKNRIPNSLVVNKYALQI